MSSITKIEPTTLYEFYDKNNILLYVGISASAMARLRQHRDDKWWFYDIKRVEMHHYRTREIALKKEKQAIKNKNPLYNKIHYNNAKADKISDLEKNRDDEKLPYVSEAIKIRQEAYDLVNNTTLDNLFLLREKEFTDRAYVANVSSLRKENEQLHSTRDARVIRLVNAHQSQVDNLKKVIELQEKELDKLKCRLNRKPCMETYDNFGGFWE